MKNTIFLFISFLLLSCNQDSPSKDKELSADTKNISITDNIEILGSWTMCSSFGNGYMIQFNVCPTIAFLSNGSGMVGNSTISLNRFTWTFQKGKLSIYPSGKVSDATFCDTFYLAKVSGEKSIKSLIINSTKGDSHFYLSK